MELIAIVGPTASGKTHKAVALAKRIGGEIISADSRQLYRGMDIGTGKDLEEYGTVPYHLIDICPAGYKYNLYEYLRDCDKAVAEIRQRGNQPIVCGGTGLYVESYLKGVRLPEVPENKALRERLEAYTLEDLTAMLAEMKRKSLSIALQAELDKIKKEIAAGQVEVKEVFKISKVGTVAGAFVTEGKVHRSDKARLIRDGIVIHTGTINALKRYKDDVKEVASGLECGISLVNFNDIQAGDIIETFTEIEVEQKL